MDYVAGTTFCVCGAKRTHLPNGQEEQAQTSVNEGCAYNQALAKLEIRPQNLRGNTCGQNGAQQYKGKDHHWEAVTKGVKLGNPEKRNKYSSIATTCDLDPICRECLHYEGRTRTDC